MSMYDVKVKVSVEYRQGMSRTEEFETKMDYSNIQSATTDSGRKQMGPWAKQFFPTAHKVEVMSISKI
jgi:hypothetical protein